MGDHGEDKSFHQQSEGSQVEERWIFSPKSRVRSILGQYMDIKVGPLVLFYVFDIQWSSGPECWLRIKD